MRLPSLLALAVLLLPAPFAHAQLLIEPYTAGQHYHLVPKPEQWSNDAGLEVVEVFNHACVHCWHFQSTLAPWKETLGKDVRFVYLEAPFRPDFALVARAYRAAEVLGIAGANHQGMYDHIWTDRKPVATLDQLADFWASRGADRAKFLEIANGTDTNAYLQRTMTALQAWEVDGTPTLIVAGKYRVVPGETLPVAESLKVVDFLLDKERKRARP